ATRATLWPCEPCGWPQPRITSSTSFLSSCGTLPSASLMQCAARSDGRVMLKDPRCDLASGVRLLATTTASLMARPFVRRVERAASVPLIGLPEQQLRHAVEVSQLVIGARDAGGQRESATIDPRDTDPERLGADHIGMLRLAAVQQPADIDAGLGEQKAEERSIRLEAARPLGGADHLEAPTKIGRVEQVVVDVRDDRQPGATLKAIERLIDVRKAPEVRERVEVVADQRGVSTHAEAAKRFLERGATDVAIRPVWLPIAANVGRLPLLPEPERVDVRGTGLTQDRGERGVRAAA